MRLPSIIALGLFLVLFSCNKDDDDLSLQDTLHYDGANFNAPVLQPGDYEAAARFTDFELNEFVGKNITEVIWYYAGLPTSTQINIYGEGTDSEPGGSVLYQANISGSLSPVSWNVHQVRNPVEITGDDIWVSIAFTHTGNTQSIGCDAGPAHIDGQWLYQSSTGEWERFIDIAGEDINWNIRLRIE